MAAFSSKYAVELWTKNGTLLMDVSKLAKNRRLTKSRNEPDVFEFEMDLDEFEHVCAQQSIDPKQVLIVNSVEVRLKRYGTYLSGGQLAYRNVSLRATSSTVSCRVFGFLWLFSKRYTGQSTAGLVSEPYTAATGTALSRKDLAWTLINQSQSLTNGNFGITLGLNQATNTTLYDKLYSRTNIKDALQAITKLQTAPIDIEITYDKKFNTYDSIGSNRPDVLFEYPGNIIQLDAPVDGTDMTNEAIAVGRGGADGTQTVVVASDTSSQASYQLRQDVVQSNGTDDSDGGVTDDAKGELAAKKNPINIPAIVVNGNVAPSITDYGIGDRVQFKVTGHPLISDINGLYRVEKYTLAIDDDDNEEVTLEVSDV